MPALSQDQIDAYRSDGFLFPVRIFDRATAHRVLGEFDELAHRWRDDASLRRPYGDYLRANLHVVSTLAARLAAAPETVEIAASVIGDDVLCWMAELIIKEPRTDRFLTMHQDLTYWGLSGADHLVTVWVALTDVTKANGAMSYVRGSHRGGQVAHADTFADDNLLSRGQEIAVEYDPADAIDVELSAGEASLHHGFMFHGSGPNTTDTRRAGLVLRYVSPAVTQEVATRDFALLVRGVNRSNNLICVAPPAADFSPPALDIFEEITAAQAAALAEGAEGALSY